MKTIASIRIILITGILCLAALPVRAQVEGRDHGFYGGARLASSTLHIEESDTSTADYIDEKGGGLQLFVGYSFNEVFSLELDLSGANHAVDRDVIDVTVGSFVLFAHYRFRPGHAFRPYVKGGLGGYGVVIDDKTTEYRIEGGGIPIGGGFDYFFNPHFSLGLDLTHNIINYDSIDIDVGNATVGFDVDEDGATTTVGISFTGYF